MQQHGRTKLKNVDGGALYSPTAAKKLAVGAFLFVFEFA